MLNRIHILWFRNNKNCFFFKCFQFHAHWILIKILKKREKNHFIWKLSNIAKGKHADGKLFSIPVFIISHLSNKRRDDTFSGMIQFVMFDIKTNQLNRFITNCAIKSKVEKPHNWKLLILLSPSNNQLQKTFYRKKTLFNSTGWVHFPFVWTFWGENIFHFSNNSLLFQIKQLQLFTLFVYSNILT